MIDIDSIELDEDIKESVRISFENGLRPYSSCDGVTSHHEDIVGYGYISFLKSDNIYKLLAFFYDKNLGIEVLNDNSKEPIELYNQILEGPKYNIRFVNKNSENTEKVYNIIKNLNQLEPSASSMELVKKIDNIVNKEYTDLHFNFALNTAFIQPYMKEFNKDLINTLLISSKFDAEGKIDLDKIASVMNEKFDIPLKTNREKDTYNEEILGVKVGESNIFIYFTNDKIDEVLELINELKDYQNFFIK